MKSLLAAVLALFLIVAPAFAADVPEEGTPAPAFTLPDQDGKVTSLESLKGKWVVLYFYPKDATPGCSLEAHNFQRDLEKYTGRNAVVIGVSADDAESHKLFCADQALTFTLLSDEKAAVSAQYGSTMNLGLATVAARNTFLIDPTGVIRKVYIGVSPATHSDDLLADLDKLQAK